MTDTWFEHSRVNTAHNTIGNSRQPYQPGGVAIISSGDTSVNIRKLENDKRYMGRWCSTVYHGVENKRIRVVLIYVSSDRTTTGSKTIYKQQQSVLLKSKVSKPVLKALWDDLWKDIDWWIKNGDKIVIGGDWNVDVQEESFISKFREKWPRYKNNKKKK